MNESINPVEFTSSLTKRENILVLPYFLLHMLVLPTIVGMIMPDIDAASLNVCVYAFGMAYMLVVGFSFLRRDFDPVYDRPLLIIITVTGAYIRMMIANYGVNDIIYRSLDIFDGEAAAVDPALFAAVILIVSPLLEETFKSFARRNAQSAPKKVFALRILWTTAQLAALYVCINDLAVRMLSPSDAANPNTETVADLAVSSYGPVFGMSVFMAPIVEEMIFRAGLFGIVRKKSRAAAYIMSILAFSAYHIIGYASMGIQSWIFILQYIPISFLLCRSYEKTNSIWTSIFLHMMVNAISMRIIQLI